MTLDAPPPSSLPTSGTPLAAQRGLYSAGARRTTGARGGLYFLSSWKILDALPKSANLVGLCVYRDQATGGAIPSYQMPCSSSDPQVGSYPAGQSATGTKAGPGNLDQYVSTFMSAGYIGEGTWGLGAFDYVA
jgi:hypothetical protein